MRVGRQALRARRFRTLMPHRVREVLLVSSPFDAFILEEDGLLSEQLFLEYTEVSLSSPPRFTHVATAEAALQAIDERRFDLILVIPSIVDMPVDVLGREVKKRRPGRPVVLLALDPKDLHEVWETVDAEIFDGTFLWSGDSNILLAIIGLVEDQQNVDHDVEHGNVRVIVMLEDSPRFYSSFLGLLYRELLVQSRSLYAEGIDELHRQMYLKSRPKILHATTFEGGVGLFQRYKKNVMAVISDLRIPRRRILDDTAGLEFLYRVREHDREMPVLLQSAEGVGRARAEQIGASFVDKSSSSLLADTRRFLRETLGFGDFVFRMPDGSELARAHDVRDLEKVLAEMPPESVAYHASHNDFSIWLLARSEFDLAERLRPRQVTDFPSPEAARDYLISMLRQTHRSTYVGMVADYSRRAFDAMPFARLGFGSLGGKARGLAFFNRLLTNYEPADFGGLAVTLPRTVVVTTDFFDRFMSDNDLGTSFADVDDGEIAEEFVSARLPESLRDELAYLVERIDTPLAVRSSSLLEDSLHQLLAGVYSTIMLPNEDPDPEVRCEQLETAVKLVYASTFYRNARAYLETTGHLLEEEKMAVIIQPIVGQRRASRFYPSFAGVAQSTNYYPIGPQRPDHGIVHVALGLGRLIVDGGLALRFSPRHPGVLPQYTSPEALLDGTQRGFFALDLERLRRRPEAELYSTVRYFGLEDAEKDGALALIGSVYDSQNDRIVDDLDCPGPRVISFNNVLRHRSLPLPQAIMRLLEVASEGLGTEVEIEFAFERVDDGRSTGRGSGTPALHILQVRPMIERVTTEIGALEISREETLCMSRRALGHGLQDQIRDVIYVRRDRWDASRNKAIAQEIGRLNRLMVDEGRPYLLIGPGRWGTSDEWLGIPVDWSQISNVRVLVEASPAGYRVEPSQGTHFFQNMTSLRLGYLTLPPGAEKTDDRDEFVDWAWLDEQPAFRESEHLRLVRLESPLVVHLDGRRRRGLIAKPKAASEPVG